MSAVRKIRTIAQRRLSHPNGISLIISGLIDLNHRQKKLEYVLRELDEAGVGEDGLALG